MNKYEIAVKKTLTPEISLISVYAPLIAKKAKAGQFIILRVDEDGESILCAIEDEEELNAVNNLIIDQLYEEDE